MTREQFPTIALLISVALLAALVFGGKPGPDGGEVIPLLALLAISELGAILNLIAAYIGVTLLRTPPRSARTALRLAANLLLAAAFALQLIRLWPL
jgi:hypothetical protein